MRSTRSKVQSNKVSFRRKLGRRLKRVTRKLIGAAVFYALMLTVGMFQAKSALCWLCRTYLQNITASEFLILFGMLSFLFMLLNCLLVKVSTFMMYPKYYIRKSRSLLYPNYKEPKYTRSGAVYGYM